MKGSGRKLQEMEKEHNGIVLKAKIQLLTRNLMKGIKVGAEHCGW